MIKLGFCLNSLWPSQQSYYIVRNANEALRNTPPSDLNISIFFENPARPIIQPEFAIFPMEEAWSFDGVLIGTSLSVAQKMINFPGTPRKYFYVNDLEWLRRKPQNYHSFANLYRSPELKLIARSTTHKNVIEDCWNLKDIPVVEDYNIKQLLEVINAL